MEPFGKMVALPIGTIFFTGLAPFSMMNSVYMGPPWTTIWISVALGWVWGEFAPLKSIIR